MRERQNLQQAMSPPSGRQACRSWSWVKTPIARGPVPPGALSGRRAGEPLWPVTPHGFWWDGRTRGRCTLSSLEIRAVISSGVRTISPTIRVRPSTGSQSYGSRRTCRAPVAHRSPFPGLGWCAPLLRYPIWCSASFAPSPKSSLEFTPDPTTSARSGERDVGKVCRSAGPAPTSVRVRGAATCPRPGSIERQAQCEFFVIGQAGGPRLGSGLF